MNEKSRGERLVHIYAHRKIMDKKITPEMQRAWKSNKLFGSKFLGPKLIKMMGGK
jgi:hypothetical protein